MINTAVAGNIDHETIKKQGEKKKKKTKIIKKKVRKNNTESCVWEYRIRNK
jgi:hypothetical protein